MEHLDAGEPNTRLEHMVLCPMLISAILAECRGRLGRNLDDVYKIYEDLLRYASC